MPRFTGWADQGLAYDVALHWGTLLALLVFFRADLIRLAKASLTAPKSRDGLLGWGVAAATVPGAIAGLLFEDMVESVFRSPSLVAAMLALFGVLLAVSDKVGRKEGEVASIGWRICLLVGLSQALAIFPGVSRSGVTITAGLFLGLTRPAAARFSFLLAVPIVFGAGVLKFKDLAPAMIDGAFFAGVAASFLSGLAAIGFLLRFVESRSLLSFGVYRVVLAAAVLLIL